MLKASGLLSIGLLVLIAGVAEAKVSKIVDYSPVLNGVSENPDVDGMTIFHFQPNKGTTAVRLNITGLQANAMYRVMVIGAGGFTSAPTETNSGGILHINHDTQSDITQDYTIDIHAAVFVDANNDAVLQPAELRALGCVSGNCTIPLVACTVDADCDDGNPCTTGDCELGFCAIEAVVCPDDSNACTFDFCNPFSGVCEYSPIFGCTP